MKLQELEDIVQPAIMQGLTELELQLHKSDFEELKADLGSEHVNIAYSKSSKKISKDYIELSYQGATIHIKQLD